MPAQGGVGTPAGRATRLAVSLLQASSRDSKRAEVFDFFF